MTYLGAVRPFAQKWRQPKPDILEVAVPIEDRYSGSELAIAAFLPELVVVYRLVR